MACLANSLFFSIELDHILQTMNYYNIKFDVVKFTIGILCFMTTNVVW